MEHWIIRDELGNEHGDFFSDVFPTYLDARPYLAALFERAIGSTGDLYAYSNEEMATLARMHGWTVKVVEVPRG
jgi:hypothetical protein